MKIIVGLGNIGEKYTTTRHNCGFLVLDEFARQLENEGSIVTWDENRKLKALTGKVQYKGEILFLVKPTTLMNLSGEAVRKILTFYKKNPRNLIVIFDDIDLPLGKIRIREKGSAGTHNGMKSVIQELGTENFTRIRIGIENRGDAMAQKQDLHSYVLNNFNKDEHSLLAKSLKEAVSELKKIIST